MILIEKYVPLWEKANLTLEEASMYFGIGQNKIRELTNSDNCPYVIWCGSKRLIKRKLFAEYLAWIIHGVAVKVAESHIVTIF